ncbi:MAG: hypothetical protein FJ241_11150 [Nitrospira sp.]|nr:hypothetical protein [Nitrospira sp.]
MPSRLKSFKVPSHLIIIFLVLSISIWAIGYLYYEKQKENIKKDTQVTLSAIADLKVSQIVNWRKDRLGDANIIFENHLVIPYIQQFMERPTVSEYKQDMFTWLASLQKQYNY